VQYRSREAGLCDTCVTEKVINSHRSLKPNTSGKKFEG
jgi:hypothetical protein